MSSKVWCWPLWTRGWTQNRSSCSIVSSRRISSGRVPTIVITRSMVQGPFGEMGDALAKATHNRHQLGPSGGSVAGDRKSVVSGKSVSVRVDIGGRRILKKHKTTEVYHEGQYS